MATYLDKDITRESSVKVDNREIQVTLTADQKISFKLKGMKSGIVSIPIEEIYNQLAGTSSEVTVKPTKAASGITTSKDNPLISLHELRWKMNTTTMDYATKALFDSFISQCIKTEVKPILEREAEIKEANKNRKK